MPNLISGITIDCHDPDRLVVFWAELLGLSESEPLPGWRQLGGRGEPGPRLNFQPVAEPKTGKARLHLDVSVDDIDDAMRQVVRLGGSWSGERHDYDEGVVVVMADPEGTEFCLVQYY